MADGSSMRGAVDLVLHDVAAIHGPDAVSVAVTDEPGAVESLASEDPGLLETLTDPGFGTAPNDVGLWIYVPGEAGAVGVWNQESDDFAELVVRVAESVQEVVVESGRFFGDAFPPCPAHPNHPLWAEVRNGKAHWACGTDPSVAVLVGQLEGPWRTSTSR